MFISVSISTRKTIIRFIWKKGGDRVGVVYVGYMLTDRYNEGNGDKD